jgi:peroxisomal enoyl-CoA hydratase 2
MGSPIKGLPSFNPMMGLHGEEKLEIYGQIKPNQKYVIQKTISDVADKGKGMLLSFETNILELNDN